jgi:cyclic pyranopterin phosphate synthase
VVGVCSSWSPPFSSTCPRARLSAIGSLYRCLFAGGGTAVGAWLRARGVAHDAGRAGWAGVWLRRPDRNSVVPTAETAAGPGKVEMSYIGG